MHLEGTGDRRALLCHRQATVARAPAVPEWCQGFLQGGCHEWCHPLRPRDSYRPAKDLGKAVSTANAASSPVASQITHGSRPHGTWRCGHLVADLRAGNGLGDLSLDVFILLLRPAGLGDWRAPRGSICTQCLMFLLPGTGGNPRPHTGAPFLPPGRGTAWGPGGCRTWGGLEGLWALVGKRLVLWPLACWGRAAGRALRGVQSRALAAGHWVPSLPLH